TGVSLYDPAHHSRNAARLSLLTELRQAVERDELVLFYQPKYAFRAADGLSVEALVRWVHPQRGFVPPMEFIPFAEQTGYIKTITLWVLERAVRQCAQWRHAGRQVSVSVNLSARDLLQADLPERFAPCSRATAVQPAGSRSRSPRARCPTTRARPWPTSSACAPPGASSRSTTTAPAIRRCPMCARCRCRR